MTTPTDLFHRLSDGLAEGRYDELSALYAEDAVIVHPTAPPRPRKLEGRQAIHELLTGRIGATMRLVAHDVVVHETTDPEVIVAEYQNTVESLKTGRTTENANILVIRARDGLIVRSHDYHDYLRLAAVRGSIEPVVDAYAQAPAHVPGPVAPRPAELADRKSPLGVFQRVCFGVSDARWAELPEFYAEQTDVRHPFLPNAPVLKTRDDLRAHFASAGEQGIRMQATDFVTYQSADPEVIIGEFAYEGELGGKPLRINNIFVVRVRDGLIVESRDYGDHLGLAATAGRLPELFASLSDQPA